MPELQCFELLMRVCEQSGCLEGAVKFAEVAAQKTLQLRLGSEGEPQAALLEREGLLWSNLFAYAISGQSWQVRQTSLFRVQLGLY